MRDVTWVRAGLRTMRIMRGYTLKELAIILGKSENLLYNVETCRKSTTYENWVKLAEVLECNVEYIKAEHCINKPNIAREKQTTNCVIKAGDVTLNPVGDGKYEITGIVEIEE